MLHRLLSALALGLLAGPAALAQVYEPGYLVKASGDTLRGEVENAFWGEAPTYVRFRAAPGAPSQLLLPRQLRAFGLDHGRYFQYQVLPIDHGAQINLSHLAHGNVHDVRQDSVLAEVLVDGPLMLWRVQREEVVHFLLRRPGQPVLELSARRYLRQNRDGRWVVADGNNYRSQLFQYFGDCPAVVQALDRTSYSAPALVALVRAYYQSCAAGQGVARSWLARSVPRRRAAAQGGVLAGLRYSHLDASCTNCAVRPFGGLYLELMQPSRVLAVYGELSLSSYGGRVEQPVYPYVTYSYEAMLLTARMGLRRLVPLPQERYFLYGFGFEYNFIGPNLRSGGSLDDSRSYAIPIVLPNLTAGWRRERLTLLADVQLYQSAQTQGSSILNFFVGNAVAVRAGASFRLGPHPDQTRVQRAAP